MSVRKICAKTSREALKLVREQLGSNAVILTNRETAHGVEILAVGEADLAGLIGTESSHRAPQTKAATKQTRPTFAQRTGDLVRRPATSSPWQTHTDTSVSVADANAPSDALNVMAEIKSMRGVLEQHLSRIAWDETLRSRPLRIKLLQAMLDAGFGAALARHISSRVPDDYAAGEAESWLKGVLAKNISTASSTDNLIDTGGVYALVGPTGVGKTTTAAKLAARCVVKHGARKLGLITADNYRIGAQDQLRIYGKILGIPVQSVQDEVGLADLLASMRDKHLVLIDTVGMGQRDARVAEQAALFGELPVRRILLLNAAAQLETLDDVVRAYSGRGLFGAILTKLDEAVKLGGALDTLIRHRLPLHFVSDGQRVPEDLHVMSPSFLVHRALSAVRHPSYALNDEEYKVIAASLPASQAAALGAN
jgi:flagellar biosynthesis protein FlhF